MEAPAAGSALPVEGKTRRGSACQGGNQDSQEAQFLHDELQQWDWTLCIPCQGRMVHSRSGLAGTRRT
jgi:hypothetical protein